jgi:hypothetical protein
MDVGRKWLYVDGGVYGLMMGLNGVFQAA